MNITPPVSLTCSAGYKKALVEGVQEILGPTDAADLLQKANLDDQAVSLVDQMSAFQSDLTARYGDRSGGGIAVRVGRSSFKYRVKECDLAIGWMNMEYRMLPLNRRISKGLHLLANMLSDETNLRIQSNEDQGQWIWQVESQAEPARQKDGGNICYLMKGILQGFLAWTSGGKFFDITEDHSVHDTIHLHQYRIDQKALD